MTKEPFFSIFDVYAGPYFGVAVRFQNNYYRSNPQTRSNPAATAVGGVLLGCRINFSKVAGFYTEFDINSHPGMTFGFSFKF
ncbi:MAG: hypothetical protein IPO21_13115 [Bacteroidales bacterium]|nr:hypothetical protein [Bacteroidales bacterium]